MTNDDKSIENDWVVKTTSAVAQVVEGRTPIRRVAGMFNMSGDVDFHMESSRP